MARTMTRQATRAEPTDPPMRRTARSVTWFESGPEPIRSDPELATAIVAVGLASNAINSVLLIARAVARRRHSAAKTRDSLALLVIESAFLKEASQLAGREMKRLRPLAMATRMSRERIERVVQLASAVTMRRKLWIWQGNSWVSTGKVSGSGLQSWSSEKTSELSGSKVMWTATSSRRRDRRRPSIATAILE
jgi:hypothetical protein